MANKRPLDTIAQLVAASHELQREYNAAQKVAESALANVKEKEVELLAFKDKYGRVVKLLEEGGK